jgi:hypothetical protein
VFQCSPFPPIVHSAVIPPGICRPSQMSLRKPTLRALRSQVFANALGTRCGILEVMWSRASRITAMVVLLTCLVCPILETFDSWDNTTQTGNDTEYTLVILALCVGIVYSFARFTFKSGLLGFVAKSAVGSFNQRSFLSPSCSLTLLLFDATSPPPLPLRI